MSTLSLSLISHTNTGKTTLARTLLGADVGEVRDAPHVTEFADAHELIATPEGDRLRLWDTPGFGDSARLAKRLRGTGNPVGWFLSQVWDRWRDRPFWASQQALRHVQAESDVVLYLVNASESPAAAGYVAAEMELLAWLGKPVLVLLNQLGEPRAPQLEADDVNIWRQHLASWPLVKQVLPLDAFARCWVHEQTLLRAVQDVLPADRAAAMARLAQAWQTRREQVFGQAVQILADSVATMALTRAPVAEHGGLGDSLKQTFKNISGAFSGRPDEDGPQARAAQALAQTLHEQARISTTALITLHGLAGQAGRTEASILQRVAEQFAVQQPVPEGKAALVGGAVTGALAGLKADIASGGLTLGGGLLAGAVLGALGAAGVARGINVVRGSGAGSWLRVSDEALGPVLQAALLRYLAVAHFGRGRGQWVASEAPPHWPPAVALALQPLQGALAALWQQRSSKAEQPAHEHAALAQALQPLIRKALLSVLQALYPAPAAGDNHAP
jgi:hypothetical protein